MLFSVIYCLTLSATPYYSQKRPIKTNYLDDLRQKAKYSTSLTIDSAYVNRLDFSKLDLSTLPALKDYSELVTVFNKVRDTRFLTLNSAPDFLRRSSWLYPDDGCFARSALARKNIESWKYTTPKKIFIFGNLEVLTANAEPGYKSVGWSYHVVPLYQLQGTAYVLDPAIDPKGPLELKSWIYKMVSKLEDATYAICDGYAYQPFGGCIATTAAEESTAQDDQYLYLEEEWNRLVQLKRDPKEELGDHPPW